MILALIIIAVVAFVAAYIKASRRNLLPIGVCFHTGGFHLWKSEGQRGMRMCYRCANCGQRAWFQLNYENPQPPPFFDQSPRFKYSDDWSNDDD